MATASSELSYDICAISNEDFTAKFEAEFHRQREHPPAAPQDLIHSENYGGKLAIESEAHRGNPLEDRVLFLMAQTTNTVKSDRWKGQARTMTSGEDSDKREMEVESFVKEACRFTSDLPEENFDKRFVSNKEGMKTYIKQFLKKRCNIAWIFFIGHGSSDGQLCFTHDDPISCPDLIDFIRNIFCEQKAKNGFPSNIQVVFTQCYGHIHKPKHNGEQNLYIYWLSSEEEPCTTSVFQMEHLGSRVCKATHCELNTFGGIWDKIEEKRRTRDYGSLQDDRHNDPEDNEKTPLYPSVRRRRPDSRTLCFCLILISIIVVVLLAVIVVSVVYHVKP